MKIYNIIENLDNTYGGPAKSVPYLCKNLNDIGLETEILSIKYCENETNSVVDDYSLNWNRYSFNYFRKSRYSKSLKKYLDREMKEGSSSKKIIHAHNLWNYIPYISYIKSVEYNIPLVISVRGSLYKWSLKQNMLQKRIAWEIFQKNILQNASCIHVTEQKELEAVRSLNINTPIAIISNGIDLVEFDNLPQKTNTIQGIKLNRNKKYILFISRIHPKKGLEYLVHAWVKIANQYQNWDLLIVGPEYDKKYLDSIKRVISDHNLQDRVVITGMLEGKERLDAFSSSSLFVLPSHTENFGIVIAEAMAAKLPIITTHGTPWSEIQEKNAGWWVELNQENIDKTLKEALSLSSDKLEQKGLNGFRLIQKYEWKYQADKMNKLYNYILNGGDKPEFIFHS